MATNSPPEPARDAPVLPVSPFSSHPVSGAAVSASQHAAADEHRASAGVLPNFAPPPVKKPPPPPIVWNQGIHAWARSVRSRAGAVMTTRFFLALVAGQFLSVCITGTNVSTTELGLRGFALPTTQTFFLYFTLLVIYVPITIYKYGFRAWGKMLLKDGWKYFILSCFDVEGNYTVVLAYQYTDILSCMLLDAWAIPVCMAISFVLLRARYHWTQILGVLICVAGLGMLVGSDQIIGNKDAPVDRLKGDLLMLLGATLYGCSNALEEYLVRSRPLYEVVGCMGLFGTLINGIQMAGLEHNGIRNTQWNGPVIGILMGYTFAMFCLYTIAPVTYRLASAAFYNLSLLTSDFWGLIFGIGLYHQPVYWLYFVAFACVLVGLVIYFSYARPEEQGFLEVVPRGKALEKQEAKKRADVEAVGVAVAEVFPAFPDAHSPTNDDDKDYKSRGEEDEAK